MSQKCEQLSYELFFEFVEGFFILNGPPQTLFPGVSVKVPFRVKTNGKPYLLNDFVSLFVHLGGFVWIILELLGP